MMPCVTQLLFITLSEKHKTKLTAGRKKENLQQHQVKLHDT